MTHHWYLLGDGEPVLYGTTRQFFFCSPQHWSLSKIVWRIVLDRTTWPDQTRLCCLTGARRGFWYPSRVETAYSHAWFYVTCMWSGAAFSGTFSYFWLFFSVLESRVHVTNLYCRVRNYEELVQSVLLSKLTDVAAQYKLLHSGHCSCHCCYQDGAVTLEWVTPKYLKLFTSSNCTLFM